MITDMDEYERDGYQVCERNTTDRRRSSHINHSDQHMQPIHTSEKGNTTY
jgi:hypothetical protein